MCNSTFSVARYKDRISEQPNIRIIKLQELIRKKLDIQVGKTTTRRARVRVLKEIMVIILLSMENFLLQRWDFKNKFR